MWFNDKLISIGLYPQVSTITHWFIVFKVDDISNLGILKRSKDNLLVTTIG